MNSNFPEPEELNEDVEGHMRYSLRGDIEDVDGHRAKMARSAAHDDGDDVEAHIKRG